MISNFKCNHCDALFRTDDESVVVCPRCGSDNVEPINIRRQRYNRWVVIVAGIALIGGIAALFVKLSGLKLVDDDAKKEEKIIVVKELVTIDTTYTDVPVELVKMSLEVKSKISLDASSGTYSFKTDCRHLPEGAKIEFSLAGFDGKVVARSSDGSFSQVPPAADKKGIYTLSAFVAGVADDEQPETIEIAGFDPAPVADAPRMTVAEVQRLLDARDISAIYKPGVGIVKGCQLKYVGLGPDERGPKDIGRLFSHLNLSDWTGVEVVSMTYDSYNRVNTITLKKIE